MLQLTVLAAQVVDLSGVGLANGVAHQAALAGLEELLGPVVIEVGADAFATAQFSDRLFAVQAFQDDADLSLVGSS